MKRQGQAPVLPSREQIRNFLSTDHGLPDQQSRAWAAELDGLPWRYIRPVVTIAINTRTSPRLALSVAAGYSHLPAFVAAARAQLERLG